jgi:ribulose-phosphate 3-epimerase
MTVNCGFGGQSFQAQVLDKVAAARRAHPSLTIQVDGGINATTAALAAAAGANAVVAGTAVFLAPEGAAAAIGAIRGALLEHLPRATAAAHAHATLAAVEGAGPAAVL